MVLTDITNIGDQVSYGITSFVADRSALKFTISQSITASASFMKFNEIYITVESSEGEVLFSRALIDPLYIGEDTVYNLDYSFYF